MVVLGSFLFCQQFLVGSSPFVVIVMTKNIEERMSYMNLEQRFPNVKFYGDCSIKSGVEIGEGTEIGEYVVISHNAKIGKNCRIFYHVSICKDAVIGDNVFLGPKVTFLNDKFPPSKVSNPPIIEDDVVVGACCVLFPGVKIGRGAKVGAGCRVTKDIPSYAYWVVEKIRR